jgi:hypothetical protein
MRRQWNPCSCCEHGRQCLASVGTPLRPGRALLVEGRRPQAHWNIHSMGTMTRNGLAFGASLALAAAASAQITHFVSPLHRHGGKFGWSVSGVPDLNGDGRGDFIIGAEAEPANINPQAGRVYVYSGATGQRLRVILPPTRQPIGTFGWSVAGTPDITGNGRGDILIGGIWEANGKGTISGRAYLYNGATGQMVRAWVSPADQDNGCFGWSLGWIPDVDGDGRPDVIIGAPFENVGATNNAGRVYIFSGATGRLIRQHWSPARQTMGNFGVAVAGIADLDGDGRGDYIIGAPNESPGNSPAGAGRVYVYSGRTGQLLRALRSGNESPGGNYGAAVAAVGDSNGDGKQEILIGAPNEPSAFAHPAGGRVYMISGGNFVGMRRITSPASQTQGNFGAALAAIPHADGSPSNRFIVGAPEENGVGRAYTFGPPGTATRLHATPRPTFKGKFGATVSGIPDTNGNGRGEAGIGAHSEPIGGRAYMYRW